MCNCCGRWFNLVDEPEKTVHLEIKDGKGKFIKCFRACKECRLGILARVRGFENMKRNQIWACSNIGCQNYKSDFWVPAHEGKIVATTRCCELCAGWLCFIYKDQYQGGFGI